MGAKICKQDPSTTLAEIKGVVVQYAVTLTDTQPENEDVLKEISVKLELKEDEDSEIVVVTRKNDIRKIDVSCIKQQAQDISKAFKFKDLNQSMNRTLDIGTLEKGILRQIERKNLEN